MPPFRSDCSWFDQIGFQPQSERQGSRTCPAPIPPVFSKKQLRRKINVIFQKNARSENPEPRLSERRAKKTKRERTHKACFGFSIRNTRHASARHGPNEFDSAPGPQSVFTKPENPKPAGTDPPPSLFPRSEPIGFPTPATENRRRQSRKSEPSGKQRRYGNGSVPSSFIKRPSSGTGFLISGRSSFRRSAG